MAAPPRLSSRNWTLVPPLSPSPQDRLPNPSPHPNRQGPPFTNGGQGCPEVPRGRNGGQGVPPP
eukprot:scaffold682_cov363-Pavlova_lutheri.AAC.70